jgi:hypothetical protein
MTDQTSSQSTDESVKAVLQAKDTKEKKSHRDSHPGLALKADGWDPTDFTSESISKNAWCCSKGHIFEVII